MSVSLNNKLVLIGIIWFLSLSLDRSFKNLSKSDFKNLGQQ